MSDCVIWNGTVTKTGYGDVWISGHKISVHRMALVLKLKRQLKPGHQANHTCNNRLCINPNHLYEGTQKENIQDAIAVGSFKPYGREARIKKMTKPPKYSESQIANVRRFLSLGLRNKEVAKLTDIPWQYISKIKSGYRR